MHVVCMGLQNNVSGCLHGTLGEMESRMLRELELMGINYLGILDGELGSNIPLPEKKSRSGHFCGAARAVFLPGTLNMGVIIRAGMFSAICSRCSYSLCHSGHLQSGPSNHPQASGRTLPFNVVPHLSVNQSGCPFSLKPEANRDTFAGIQASAT